MKNHKPAWWQLYLLVPAMFVLFGAEHFLPLPGISDGAVDAGIVVFTFAAVLFWVHLNGGLLEWYEVDKDRSYYDLKITVLEARSNTDCISQADVQRSDEAIDRPTPRSYVQNYSPEGTKFKDEHKWYLN